MGRRGRVFIDRDPVAWLEETETGTVLRYDPSWVDHPTARPVSLTLPVRREPYETEGIHPFFLGLLPEGWLLDVALKKTGIERTDAFGLILALTRDCAGAVWVQDATLPEPRRG